MLALRATLRLDAAYCQVLHELLLASIDCTPILLLHTTFETAYRQHEMSADCDKSGPSQFAELVACSWHGALHNSPLYIHAHNNTVPGETDIWVGQAIACLVSSFCSTLEMGLQSSHTGAETILATISEVGFLFCVQSLLSNAGSEAVRVQAWLHLAATPLPVSVSHPFSVSQPLPVSLSLT